MGAVPIKGGELLLQEAVAYRAEGRRYQQVGDLRRAAASFQKAVAANPSYSDAHNDLGVVLEGLGDLIAAERAYTTALQLNPRLVVVHSNLALLYEKMGKMDEAAAHWTARVKAGPAENPWVGKARRKLEHYRYPVPETAAELGRRRKAEIAGAVEKGRAYLRERRWKEASEEFERALALEPGNPRAAAGLRSARAKWKAEEESRARREDLERRRQARQAEKVVPAPAAGPDAKALAQQMARERREAEAAARKKQLADEKAKAAQEKAKAAQEKAKAAQPKAPPKPAGDSAKKAALEADRIAKEFAQAKAREFAQEKAGQKQQPKTQAAPPPSKPAPPESARVAGKVSQEKEESRRRAVGELIQRGISAMRQGRYAEAVVHYEQALALDPKSAEAGQGLKRAKAALAKAPQGT